MILKTILKSFGVENILEADGPLGGFSLIATEDIDLVLLDFFFGEHDGHDIVELLRTEMPCLNFGVPIIIVTAAPSHRRVLSAKALGADAILGKPLTPVDLYEAIDGVFTSREIRFSEADNEKGQMPKKAAAAE